MTVAMWISFLVLISACQFQHSEAQTTENVTETAENDLTLSCSLTGTFSLPEWVGPPNLLIYTSLGDVSEAINPAAPAASRLKFATNKRDLVLSNVQKSDAGVYKCSFTALGFHTITLIVEDAHCKCECDCECRTIVIVSIVFGTLGALCLLIVVGIPAGVIVCKLTSLTSGFKGCFNERKTLLLTSGVIGIVFDVLSLVLSIVVTVKECCECCEENCEDSECCKDWIDKAAIAFIVIPCVAVVASAVIFVLVKLDVIRLGNDGGNDGGNNGGRGHGGGHGTNSNTVHSRREDTHRGTLSDRANSDGEVSRKDVHVQENRDNFSGRPMPPIPLTDKKGRGLSANYDDDHPMITVGIPDKRAGDLGPLDEEPRKKKKKKRKQVNDDDDE